ncbi:hypothetical protein WJX77_000353 [Trebouxia sp. C0004]
MAKSELYGQSPSQQQTSSPRKAKPAVSEPALVAGQEVVGRQISVFQGSVKNPEWWDGKVMEFNPDSAQHLIRYHKAHSSEEWLQLSEQPFQWKGSPPSGTAPNPTVRGIKLNDSILGRKVKVFWPTMCKWYLGSIKEFDPHSSRHTIKYKDGEVKDHALYNEAVWWLDVDPDAKVMPNARSRGQSNSSRGGSPDARLPGKKQSRSTGRTSGGSSDRRRRQQHSTTAETSHRSQTDTKCVAIPAAQVDSAGPQASAAQTEARPRAGAEAGGDADRDCHSGIFAAASGNADTDAENGYASQHSQRQDPAGAAPPAMQDEEEQTQDHVPRQNPAAKPSRMATLRQGRSRDWTTLAEDTRGGRSRAATPKGGEGRGVLDEPGAGEAIIGARVGIFWEDDETFYKGQVAGFDAYHKRSKVCYDDGQEEWISLSKERFRWFTPRGCTSKHFNSRMKSVMTQLDAIDIPAGSVTLPQPSVPGSVQTVVSEAGGRGSNADSASTRQLDGATAVPQGAAAVGWGLSIYSQAEEIWVRGEVISWNSRQGQYHVLYEDGEDEWLKLAKENVQWHSSRSTISETAGLQKGRQVPQGLEAVGWRIGVYWREDHKFYLGELATYNDEEDLYEMNYDDNEKEDIFLTEQPIKWLLPPGLSTTGEPPEALPRPKRSTSNSDPSVKFKRQPSSRRLAQDRRLEKQRFRLGVTRHGSGIQKVTAATPKTALLSALPHISTSPAIFPTHDAYPASTTAVAPAAAAAIAPTPAATAAAGADSAIIGMPLAVASRVPPPARLGSSSTPHIDRVIALGSRRAPHLAGTRVKIYCSQGGRGIKTRRSACELGSDSTTSRRVRQKVEALDLMIWRCECARKVITKGAPIPVSTLSGPDTNKPPTLLQCAPVAGLIANQVTARLGATQSLPTNFSAGQLPPSCTFGRSQATAAPQIPAPMDSDQGVAEHLPSSSQQEAGHQLQHGRQVSPDPPELIHQLPSSAPMLAPDDNILFRDSAPQASDAQQHVRAGGSSPTASQRNSPSPAVSTGYSPSRQAGALSRSPGTSLPANTSPNPMGSCHGSPGSASLAGLIPSTTAVTVPSPHSHAPYSVISAARAAIVSDHTVPVVTIQDARISLPATSSTDNARRSSAQLLVLEPPFGQSEAEQQRPLAKLPALNKALRMQDSVGIPDTPDTESLEHHAVLQRERSSFSKTMSMDGVQQDSAAASLQRKGVLSTSGLLDLAMSDALPAADLEPDMFAAFFADSGAFSDKPDPAVSLLLHDASNTNA